jgi:septal ring factor EnvC (AmiA/AmiB activator)
MYEAMPADDHQAFAGLKPAELKAVVPEQTVAEYARDGQAANADDPAERKAKEGDKEKFVRRLRDYRLLLVGLFRDRTVMNDRIASATADIGRVEASIAESKRQEEYCRSQIDSLKKEVAEARHEQDATVAHRKAVESKLNQLKQLIDTGIASNRAMADELGRLQLDATRRIDQRAGTMASALQ